MILVELIIVLFICASIFTLFVWILGYLKTTKGNTKTYVLPKIKQKKHTLLVLVKRFFIGTKPEEISYHHTLLLSHQLRKLNIINKLLKQELTA